MAKKTPARKKSTRKPIRTQPAARKLARSTTVTVADIEGRVDAAMASLLRSKIERRRFVSLESPEPGQVHIALESIEVVSHPVQKAAGEPYVLYITLSSGQKTLILDTPENRTVLGLPFQPPMTPRESAPARPNPRAPRLRPGGTLRQPPAAAPAANTEPIAHDEDDAEVE